MNLENITLISFGIFEKEILEMVIEDIEREFLIPVRIRDGHLDLSEFYDAARRQYDGNKLIKEIDSNYGMDDQKTLGLFNVDLFIPILTYIFGQAFLGGRTGIASIYRLSNESYGLKANKNLLVERFRKEIIHELGHTFGLIHCRNIDCVMRSSTYVEDIDQKNAKLCNQCRTELASLYEIIKNS